MTLGSQVAIILASGVAIAGLLTLATDAFGPQLVRYFIL